MKINVPGKRHRNTLTNKHKKKETSRPQWLRKITISHHGLENKHVQVPCVKNT